MSNGGQGRPLPRGLHTPALRFGSKRFRVFHVLRRVLISLLPLAGFAASVAAEPLSKKTDIDFFRDVPSRNLKGLASRSDGRLVSGPALIEISAPPPADLLWCLESTPDAGKWLVGTGNAFGETWTIVRMNIETGETNAVAKFQNCTAAWFPDSKRIINSYRPARQEEPDGGKMAGAVCQKAGYGWSAGGE